MVDEINFENNKKNSREIHQVILLIFDSIRDQSLSLSTSENLSSIWLLFEPIYDVLCPNTTSRPYAPLVIIYRRKVWQGVEKNGQVMECAEYFSRLAWNFSTVNINVP